MSTARAGRLASFSYARPSPGRVVNPRVGSHQDIGKRRQRIGRIEFERTAKRLHGGKGRRARNRGNRAARSREGSRLTPVRIIGPSARKAAAAMPDAPHR